MMRWPFVRRATYERVITELAHANVQRDMLCTALERSNANTEQLLAASTKLLSVFPHAPLIVPADPNRPVS